MFSLRHTKALPFYISTLTLSLFSASALADATLFTALDDPSSAKKSFDGSVDAGYTAQSGNTANSSLAANSTLTWFQPNTAYSLWGAARNTSANNQRSSERYQLGGRTRYNLTDRHYIFGQASWLTDRYNGFDSRSVLTTGYGRQVMTTPLHNLRVEFGPGVRHDEFYGGGRATKALAYGGANYTYQLTDNTVFSEGVSALANEETTLNSETALNVAINKSFALRLAYIATYNTKPPTSAPKNTDTTTSITLVYGL